MSKGWKNLAFWVGLLYAGREDSPVVNLHNVFT